MNEKVGFFNAQPSQRQDRLRSLLQGNVADTIPALMFICDARSQLIRYGNRRFIHFTGRRADNLFEAGLALAALVHSQDLWKVERMLSAPDYAGPSGPVRLSDRTGKYVYHDIEASPLKEGALRSQRFLLIAHDITDVLKGNEETQTTRALLQETEELLQFGSWAWDLATNSVTWTSGLYSLLGYTPPEVEGKVGFEFYVNHLVEEYAAPFRTLIEDSIRQRTDFSYEYLVKTRAGAIKNVSTKGKLVRDEDGEVIKVLCINRDVTALRNFEKEQERNIRELNRSNRDLEEFAYIASHDLQEPLRKISMFTERLKAKCQGTLDREGELFIQRILASAGNMRTLIDNLLDFSRANRRATTFDQVDIRSAFEAVLSELELKIEEAKATIRLSGTFPVVEAVESEMKQLFGNILSNAVKFRRPSVPPHIEVQSGRLGRMERSHLGLPANGAFHKIEITDNGIGFEPEYGEKIFQIFQRLNGKAEYPGSGIGLAICKKIVEKHNGTIFANSIPDKGATFTVILPEKQF